MSESVPERPKPVGLEGAAYAIVVSRYNSEFTSALLESARVELLVIDPLARIEVVEVPGAFEIPLAVELVAEKQKYAAVIALGLIIKGSTSHADLIATAVTQSLLQSAIRHRIPVIHEVLLVNSVEQARERCIGERLNRGVEAARAAVAAATSIFPLRTSHASS